MFWTLIIFFYDLKQFIVIVAIDMSDKVNIFFGRRRLWPNVGEW